MTPFEFYSDAVAEQIKRLDAIGSDLEMVYSSLDLAYEMGNPTEGAEATARLFEEDEARETERLTFFVSKRDEYRKLEEVPLVRGFFDSEVDARREAYDQACMADYFAEHDK